MSLSVFDILVPDQIELNLRARNQGEAITGTTNLLALSPYVLDLRGFEREVLAREQLSTTSVGNGLAFPHARTETVGQIVVAAGRSREGVLFENSGQLVHLIFVIGTPKNMVREYLGLVGDLARRVKQATVRDHLMTSNSAAEFLAALQSAPKP